MIPFISPFTAITMVVFASSTNALNLSKTSWETSTSSASISLRLPAKTAFSSPSIFTFALKPLPVMFSKSSTANRGRSSLPSFANLILSDLNLFNMDLAIG